jgi:hypothetical protein
MGEEHAIIAVCPKNTNDAPPAKYRWHHRVTPMVKIGAHIRSSRRQAPHALTAEVVTANNTWSIFRAEISISLAR